MSRQTGRIHLSYVTDDAGAYLDNQTSRLYRFLRGNTGTVYTGVQLDVDYFHQHHARNTSTRKSEINAQVDPRVEWIDHWTEDRKDADGRTESVHCYRHRFTAGSPPGSAAKRCTEILEGTGQPVRGAGQPTRYAPGQRPGRPAARPAEAQPQAVVATPVPSYDAAADGRLFDSRPVRW